jgi:competence protein ComEC
MRKITGLVLLLALRIGAAPEATTRWVMLDVTPGESQADCHLITLPDGRHVLIDVAEGGDAPGTMLAQLRKAGVEQLALVVISHFHRDHYGQLPELLASEIKVEKVALNAPDKRAADSEKPWGCDWWHVQQMLELLRKHNVPYITPAAGDRLLEVKLPDGTAAGVDVISLYDGFNTPLGQTDVNDTSIILRLFHGKTRALFTGDLNHPMGAYLAESELDLRADLLKVPHHGTEGAAPNSFFNRVRPRAALVPSPKKLWTTVRSKRIRDYFYSREIPVYVSGDRGNVTVTLDDKGYHIETER